MSDYTNKISEELGFSFPDFELDGTLYRYGRRNRYWAVGHEIIDRNKSYIIINYGDWHDGKTRTYKNYEKRTFETFEFLVRQSEIITQLKKKVEEEKLNQQRACREEWWPKYEKLFDPIKIHSYLEKKGLSQNGNAKIDGKGRLCIPLVDFESFNGLQFITSSGEKWYSSGLKKKGSFAYLGAEYKDSDTYYFCEGYATGLTLLEALKAPVIVCLDCHNLGPVVESFKRKYSNKRFIVCADNDQYTDGNPGVSKANAIKGVEIKFPIFSNNKKKLTDFNDLHYEEGIDTVYYQINSTIPQMSKDLIPEAFKTYVEHGLKTLDVPLEFIIYPLISSYSAILSNKVLINPYGDYYAPCHLWSLGLGKKGCRKYAALDYSTRFLYKINNHCLDIKKETYKKNKKLINLYEHQLKDLKPKKGCSEHELNEINKEAEDLKSKLLDLIPKDRSFIFQDFTLAALIKTIKENQFGIVGIYDEMSSFFQLINGAYNEGTANFFLQGWNKSGTFRKILASGDEFFIDNYMTSFIGKIQPSMLRHCFAEKDNAGTTYVDSGFLDRFQLIYYPDKINPSKKINTKKLPPKEIFKMEELFFQTYDFLFNKMDALKVQEIGELDEKGKIILSFDEDAFKYYLEINNEIKEKHYKAANDFEEGYYSKADRFILSLSGIFFMLDYFNGDKYQKITKRHLELSKKWIDFTYHHSKKVFTLLM